MWRFRGVDPWEAHNPALAAAGIGPAWPSRHDAMLTAFAAEAAENERAARDIRDAFAGGDD